MHNYPNLYIHCVCFIATVSLPNLPDWGWWSTVDSDPCNDSSEPYLNLRFHLNEILSFLIRDHTFMTCYYFWSYCCGLLLYFYSSKLFWCSLLFLKLLSASGSQRTYCRYFLKDKRVSQWGWLLSARSDSKPHWKRSAINYFNEIRLLF